MKRAIAAVAALGVAVSGCATAPSNISASYVSPVQYQSYSCEQIQQELQRVSANVASVTGQQQSKANNDALAMGVGMVLFWPALFFLASGDDKKEELSRLKGEYEALNQAANMKNCGRAPPATPVAAAS